MNNSLDKSHGKILDALLYPFLLVCVLWIIFMLDRTFQLELYHWGIKPLQIETWKGVFTMPLIHSQADFSHIINNSIPLYILTACLIYFYRQISLPVFLILWIIPGILVLSLAGGKSYHIGISGVIYALFGFLMISGVVRKFKPVQAITLFVVFLYGSLIYGVFPTDEPISWEGHLFGLVTGVITGILFRKIGPQETKYQFEVEKELGIEPPDLEGEYNERLAAYKLQKELEEERLAQIKAAREQAESNPKYIYHFIEKPRPSQHTEEDGQTDQK